MYRAHPKLTISKLNQTNLQIMASKTQKKQISPLILKSPYPTTQSGFHFQEEWAKKTSIN